MEHLLIRVVNFSIVAPYPLRVVFEDGTEQTIDFEPILIGRRTASTRPPKSQLPHRLAPAPPRQPT